MFLGIHHVAIIVSNYERSKYFYITILGFKILCETFREDRESYKLDLLIPGGTQLELFTFPKCPPRLTNPEACGLRHLALATKNINRVRDKLILAGLELEPVRIDDITKKRFFFFKDPDGLPIEVYESI